MTDGIKLEGRNALSSLENKISNFKSITGSEQDEFIQAMKTTKNGSKILQEINEFNLAKGVKNINPESMLKALAAPIGSKKFLSSNTTDTAMEGILRSISDRMGAIEGSLASKRQFAQEAERALAAKGFLGSNQNLLRLQTLAGMTGLGGLLSFGPAGAIGGATLALTLANPTNLGKMLISAEKNALKPKRNFSKFNKSFKMDDNKRAILKALISSKVRDSEEKNKRLK